MKTAENIDVQKNSQRVKKSYLYGLVGAFALAGIASLLASWINSFHFVTHFQIRCVQIFSIIPLAAALYGQRGWEIQTYGGATKAENLNRVFYNILSTIGFFLSVLAFQLES